MNQPCAHSIMHASLERWDECHWYVHQIEQHYHDPATFRFSLNAFIRATKEIPQVLKMELQSRPNFAESLKPMIDALLSDPLFAVLKKKRDFLVHQGSLALLSNGRLGVTEGRGWKMAISFPVHPWESSYDAYERYKSSCRAHRDTRMMIGPDGGQWPMLWREWKIADFDRDLLEIAVSACEMAGEVIARIAVACDVAEVPTSLTCCHDPERVKYLTFSRRDFFKDVDGVVVDEEGRPLGGAG